MKRELVDKIISSLEDRSENWSFEKYTAGNGLIRIWIGNGRSGLSVSLVDSDPYYSRPEIGGCSVYSFLFIWFIPWRWRLWKALESAKNKQVIAELNRRTIEAKSNLPPDGGAY